NRRIYSAMLKLTSAGKEVDPIFIAEYLRSTNELERVGGLQAIGELTHGLPRILSLKGYIDTLRESSQRRRAIAIANELWKRATGDESMESIYAFGIDALTKARQRTTSRTKLTLTWRELGAIQFMHEENI